MEYFKHGDKVKVLFGQTHDRLQNEYVWNTEEYEEIEIRITRDFSSGELVLGLKEFNINYPGDVHGENEEYVIFELFNYAFRVLKEGKEFEYEQPKASLELPADNPLFGAKVEEPQESLSLGTDTHLMDLIKILKSLSVKKIIFQDDNEIEIK